MRLLACVLLLVAASALASAAAQQTGQVSLAALFQDHAVLQRDQSIRIWGRAHPGEKITLSLGANRAETATDAAGRWHAQLPAMPAGGPYDLVVHGASGASQTVKDVLIGDVWLCSGQSNMVLEVRRSLNAPHEISVSADDGMRLLTVGLQSARRPLEEFALPMKWAAAGPETVPDFSAACFFFAQELRKTRNIPMGLVVAAWGGSTIQAWMSEAALQRVGGYDDGLSILAQSATDEPAAQKRWGHQWEAWWSARNKDSPWRDDTSAWKPVPAMTAWETWGVPEFKDYDGLAWFAVDVTLNAQQAQQKATLSLGNIDEVDETWVNGQPVGASGSGDRSYFLPAGALKPGRNTIVISVLDTYAFGGLYDEPEKRALRLADGSSIPLDPNGWRVRIANGNYGPPPRAPWESLAGLTTIANGMIAPMHDYAFKGVLWYQGESNADRDPGGYGKLLAGLMADWRARFALPDLPFLIVQLANYGAPATHPGPSGWAEVRDQQRAAVRADKRAALAVAIDLGEWFDIHPPNKEELGKRLSRAARHLVYGEALAPSGPWAERATRQGGEIIVTFSGVTGSLRTLSSDHAIGFELCNAAATSCRYAIARVHGSRATLTVGKGPAELVRFCWADSPVCNVYDDAGLPAGPFRMTVK